MATEKRLISLDEALEATHKEVFWTESEQAAIRSFLVKLPRADAVEVVRCKDCKHSKLPAVLTQKYGEPGTLTCHNWHSPCNKRNVNQADFCSYGERKDND